VKLSPIGAADGIEASVGRLARPSAAPLKRRERWSPQAIDPEDGLVWRRERRNDRA